MISTHLLYADIKAEFSSVILLQLAPTVAHKNYWSVCRTLGEIYWRTEHEIPTENM